MRMITLSNGETVEVKCLSCALTSGLVEPDGGIIGETAHFHAHQDVAYPIKGLVIVASKRHVISLDELTEEERQDYISFLAKIRRAQRAALGIEHVYYFYNEDTTHHFHTWMVPRYPWMERFGRSVESVRPVLLHARTQMNDGKSREEMLSGIQRLTAELKKQIDS